MSKPNPALHHQTSSIKSFLWMLSRYGRAAKVCLQHNPYNTAVFSVGAALVLMLLLDPLVEMTKSPFLLFFGAVVISAWQGGIRSGLVATVLSALVSNYFFIEPIYSFALWNGVGLAIFILEGILISFLCGALRTTNQKLDRNILQLRHSEESLQAVNQRITDILESITDGFYALDRQWRFTHINSQAEQTLGRSRDELLGQLIWDAVPEMRSTRFEATMHQATQDDKPLVFESYNLLQPSRWFEVHVNPLNDGLAVYFQDVTERKRSQDELRLSENRYRTLANAVPQMMWVNAADGTTQFFNQQWLDYTGLSLEGSLSGWLYTLHPDDAKSSVAIRTHAIEVGQDYEMEVRIKRVDGMYRWHLARVVPLKNEIGRVLNWFGTATDIHNVKQVEDALRQSEERFRLATRAVDGVVYDWDIRTQTVFRSEGLRNLIGIDPASVPADKDWWSERIHPDDLARIEAVMAPILQGSSDRYEFEYRVWHEDGHWVDVWDRGYLIRSSEDELVRVVGSTADITKRKQMEETLKRSEERLRFAIEGAEIGTWDHDLTSGEILWSKRAQAITGLTTPGLDYNLFFTLLHPSDRQHIQDAIERAVAQREDYDVEVRVLWPDQTVRWTRFIGRAYYGSNDLPTRMAGVVLDITTRKQIEEERERLLRREQVAREAAESANRIKDEFLAVLSHELRSPLNPILGWSRLLRTQKLNEAKTTQALETIERNAKLQSELIEDLLDVSRILRGKLSLSTAPVHLVPIIEAAIETVRLAAEAKSIEIHTALSPDVGQVLGDANRLQQIVWNLLSNAVKFTPAGGRVTVQLGAETLPPEEWTITKAENTHLSYAQITVTDTGKGIEANFLPHVFEYFRQADSATTRKYGGLGLGLAIVHHLVELHGGMVQADSPGEGMGSTFTVRLPLMPEPAMVIAETPVLEPAHSLRGIKILIVDDDSDTREFITFVLQQAEADVLATSSADEALALLVDAKPDLLLSDIGMPEVDGYMLMRQVRALPSEHGGMIPAIALTAFAGDIHQEQALNAGFQIHLSKPVEPAYLIATVVSLVPR